MEGCKGAKGDKEEEGEGVKNEEKLKESKENSFFTKTQNRLCYMLKL